MTHHVFLVPGFFGFVNFGRMVYFSHVRDFLADAFARERLRVEIHRVALHPTASLRVRASELHRAIHESVPASAPIHIIGHSTGGLDARLLCTPGVTLDGEHDVEDCARRVRSVVSVASPHRGTPLAGWFSSMMGQEALRILSLATITVLRSGRLPAALLVRGAAAIARVSVVDKSSPPSALLDQLESELLGNLEPGHREMIGSFVRDVQRDQALMPQLTPEVMDLFATTTSDRPTVRYGCVTACAAAPSLRTRFRFGLRAWAQAEYTLYAWLHRRVGEGDGIVPLASQRHGELIHEATGDHLDVIGHFDAPKRKPPHVDWLITGSNFERPQFEELWTRVARYVARR